MKNSIIRNVSRRTFSRRAVLRGAGVALALPWLESLAPTARAQATGGPKRFITVFFPNGTVPDYWVPSAAGEGAAWTLSPILEPLAPLKSKVAVLSNMENYTPWKDVFNDDGQSHGRRPGCFLTAANVLELQEQNNGQDINGISADQVIAQHAMYSNLTPLGSLQLGCGTSENACDGPPCSYSRNITWQSATQPLDPEVDPGAAFDRIVGSAGAGGGGGAAGAGNTPDPLAAQRRALNQSVLDAVKENTATVQGLLGAGDRAKMEQFMEAIRASEQRIVNVSGNMQGGVMTSIDGYTRPTLTAQFNLENTDGGYNKNDHMDVMNDLIVMALETDTTRIITHMVEHERSEFEYNHVAMREFSAAGSVAGNGTCNNYHGSQHGNMQEFASITHWNVQKIADLATRLDMIEDGPGVTVLDNTIIVLASCMDGSQHYGDRIPVALIGGAGGAFKMDQHIQFPANPNDRPLRDLYFTIMNGYFGIGATDFGNNAKGNPIQMITELMA
jgi:hypothetical protein